jgi:DNA-binding helix-hairpin-helix protein with protein kinase domain
MAQIYDSNGREVRLGTELGRGGEGAVFELPGTNNVAKVYLKDLAPDKSEKLSLMASIASPDLLRFSGWPTAILKNRRGTVVGFAMSRVSPLSKEIHRLYSPKSRRSDFPNASFKFLIHAGTNTARAFASVHSRGHVIGDVNHGNILVSDKGIVTLIDCDSYQVTVGGKRFLCGVGVPTYTPPELQDGSFEDVIRTPNHDCFGLAVLIFHLLFMGRHPFAGRFLGSGDMSIERAIEEFRFSFSTQQQRTHMLPPPHTLELAEVTAPVAALFETAFSPSAVSGGRPSAADWAVALDTLQTNIRQCSANLAHFYASSLRSCPWCRIESATAVCLFGIAFVGTPGVSGFNLERVRAATAAIASPPPLPATPSPHHFLGKVGRSSGASSVAWRRLGASVSGLVCVVIAILMVWATAPGAILGFFIIVAGLYVCSKRMERARSIGQELTAKVAAATGHYQGLVNRWTKEGGDAQFVSKKAELEKAKKDYGLLASDRLQRLQQLEKEKYQRQLKRYLEKHRIEDATIPGIGPGLKDVLASYGIEDAYDVDECAVVAVPQFGPDRTAKLVAWRERIRSRFMFNAREPSDPHDIKAIEQDIAAKRSNLERHLASGPQELARVAQDALRIRAALLPQLEAAAQAVAQAQADTSLWPF